MTRCAQFASICFGPASLSTPSSKNGPICSRGRAASSRTTGSCSSAMASSCQRATLLQFALDARAQRPDGVALFLVIDEPDAAIAEAAQTVKVVPEIAGHLADR